MDATRLLEKDHAAVRKLSKQYEKAGDRAFITKAKIVASMKAELDAHMAIEEEIFYPAMKAARSEDARETVREGVEARKLFSKERLEKLGEHMEKRKESLLAVASD